MVAHNAADVKPRPLGVVGQFELTHCREPEFDRKLKGVLLVDAVFCRPVEALLVLFTSVASCISFAPETRGGTTELVSVEADGHPVEGYAPSMSADGRFIAFGSGGRFVPGGGRLLVRDRLKGTTLTVNGSLGMNGFGLSFNGRWIVFMIQRTEPGCPPPSHSFGTLPTTIFVYDVDVRVTSRFLETCAPPFGIVPLAISDDGRFILAPLATGMVGVLDRQTGQTIPTVVAETISADGRLVAGRGPRLPFPILVEDVLSGTVEEVYRGESYLGDHVGLSADGRIVVFPASFQVSMPVVNYRGGVFVRDRPRAASELVSVTNDGAEPNGDSCLGAISANGQYVAFVSKATNLVAGGSDPAGDVFVRDRLTRLTERVNVADDGSVIHDSPFLFDCPGARNPPAISGDGRLVAFERNFKVFVRDRGPTVTSFVTDLYQNVLGRPPDLGGLEGWETFLSSACNQAGFGVIAADFFDSSEFRGRPLTLDSLVGALYRALLGRNPDSGGLAGYTAAFQQERINLARAFLASPEFLALLPNRQDAVALTAAITRLYSEMLQRLPNDPELAGWVRYVATTGDIEDAVAEFIRSSEFEARPLTFADYVRILYLSLLARAPDAGGARNWEATLRTHIVDIVTESFIPSAEFQTRRRNICRT